MDTKIESDINKLADNKVLLEFNYFSTFVFFKFQFS